MKSERACNADIMALPEATVAIVHKQAEECLSGTVFLATATHSRATTLTGIFGGAAVALLAASATVLAAPEHKSYLPLLIALLVAAMFLFAAAILCAFACRPIDYFVGGYEPKYLSKSATDLTWMLRYATDDVQARIDANREALAAGALKVTWAMWLAVSNHVLYYGYITNTLEVRPDGIYVRTIGEGVSLPAIAQTNELLGPLLFSQQHVLMRQHFDANFGSPQ